jgi:hypothetical protein
VTENIAFVAYKDTKFLAKIQENSLKICENFPDFAIFCHPENICHHQLIY